jgi:hypothetical protein
MASVLVLWNNDVIDFNTDLFEYFNIETAGYK